MDVRLVQGMSIAGLIENVRLRLGKIPFDDLRAGCESFSSLLIDLHNIEAETSGGGGELRIVSQQ